MSESPAYLAEQLIAYRGNKRKLLSLLEQGLQRVRQRLGDRKLRILDGFAGSGICSRFFKQHANAADQRVRGQVVWTRPGEVGVYCVGVRFTT